MLIPGRFSSPFCSHLNKARILLFFVVIVIITPQSGFGLDLTILFSANVGGEIDACG